MAFSDICGHGVNLNRLRKTLVSGKLAHAYLFSGPWGIGKRTIACGLLGALYCERHDFDFCGVCKPCNLVFGSGHPDVHVLRPVEGKKETTIDQVRDLVNALSLKPVYGMRKAVLIEEAETLGWAAQNALLKVLEEPRGDSLFILLTLSPSNLLPTIVSRCHLMKFQCLSSSDVSRILVARGMDQDRAALLSRLCQGSVGKALELDGNRTLENRPGIVSLLQSGRGNANLILDWCEGVCSTQGNPELSLDLLETCLRDAMILKYEARDVEIMNSDLAEVLKEIASAWNVDEALALFDEISRCRVALERNAQKELALEASLMRALL